LTIIKNKEIQEAYELGLMRQVEDLADDQVILSPRRKDITALVCPKPKKTKKYEIEEEEPESSEKQDGSEEAHFISKVGSKRN